MTDREPDTDLPPGFDVANRPGTAASRHQNERGMTRRRVLGLAGATAGAVAAGSVAGGAIVRQRDNRSRDTRSGVVPFYGAHQAGIATPAQDRLLFASFDLVTDRRTDLQDLLAEWTTAAARLTRGDTVGAQPASAEAPPVDTGEALDLAPAGLTLTFGFGPTVFSGPHGDRFGLAGRRPAALADLPAFAHDALDPARSGGDLCVQACGNDPVVCFHAIRNLTRIGRGAVVLRWSQEGFGRTSSTATNQVTARNLMGFKDGTANLRAGTRLFDDNVWVRATDDPGWMRNGSYLVTRRIRMLIENWDRSSLADQEQTIGRVRVSGAPLGGHAEFDPVNLEANDANGQRLIPARAHIAVANQDANKIHILRRGYNFTDGVDPRLGELDAGLFFIAYQRDPRRQFVPLQRKLAANDALNEYIKHVGSAVFAVPGGIRPGEHIAPRLFT